MDKSYSARCATFFREAALPHLEAWEAHGSMPVAALLRQAHAHGLSGLRFAPAHGGVGAGLSAQVDFLEALGRVPCGGLHLALTIHYDMVAPMLAAHATPALVDGFLRPALQAGHVLAHAVSEPQAGSDVSAVQTRAEPTRTGYTLHGHKAHIALATQAHAFLVMAQLPQRRAPFDKVLLMVPRQHAGVHVGPAVPMLGSRACDVADVRFTGAHVPHAWQVGAAGKGLVHQQQQFFEERILAALRINAAAEAQLALLSDYLRQRQVGGRPLIQASAVVAQLASLAIEVRGSAALARRALTAWQGGQTFATLSAMAKLQASRTSRQVAAASMSLFGAGGYAMGSLAARYWRDSRLHSLSTGSDEMMLTLIAKDLRGPHAA